MRPASLVAPVIAGLLLALTYLLVQGAAPDAALHERTLDAVRSLILNDATLRSDVLRGRGGLLRNYDPLVRSVEALRDATATLEAAGVAAHGEAGSVIARHAENVAAAVRDQERLVEEFKSSNALLQNSLSYFIHLSHELDAARAGGNEPPAATAASVANAMLRFLNDPRPDVAPELAASLDRLALSPGGATENAGALVSHGRLILATLPAVDDVVGRLLSAPTSERARSLQDVYLEVHAAAAARAGIFRVLLYVASVLLVVYLAYLFLRLRANARSLQARLSLEKLIAGISTQFINLPRDRIDQGIDVGLARLAAHMAVDRAYIALGAADGKEAETIHEWRREGVAAGGRGDDAFELASRWTLDGYRRHGGLHVPSVRALPESWEKAVLERRDVRSWLCLPMWPAGQRLGLIGFDAVASERRWRNDDIALLRTAGEIFANALERQRAETEREALEARLHQAQRMEAIGTLAGGIAHEFNNILGAILGYAEMALSGLAARSRPYRHLQQVMKAGQRAQGVIDQILAFSRRGDRQHRPVRLRAVVDEALELLRVSLPATITIRVTPGAEDAVMLGDPTALQQVVMNLCTNAAQAMDGRGTLEVELDAITVEGELVLSHGTLAAGRYVRLAVTDAGHGIDVAAMDRIFEPFFTTKPAGRGTGLGLPTVHGIVAQHGGALNVRSRPGAGSTFEAYFPRAQETDARADRKEDAAPRGHGETILIVDDEEPLVRLGEEMLAALGYEPVGFDNAPAALAAFRAAPQRFDLALTDEVMPDMTGAELASALHAMRPELPVVLMTGYSGPVRSHRQEAAGIREILKKPLLSGDIARALARHLPAPHGVARATHP